MAIITRQFLTDIGVEMSEADFAAFSEHFESELDERIVNEIVDELSPEQAEELTVYKQKSDEELQQWLVENVEDLGEIINEEVTILLGEIAENSQSL